MNKILFLLFILISIFIIYYFTKTKSKTINILGNGRSLKDFDFNMQSLLKSNKALEVIKFIKDSKCHCTFEYPKYMDVLYNKKFYPKLFRNTLKRIFK